MPFQWPLAKIDLIQSALAETGDNVPPVANDGSDEWNVASPAYERWIAYVMATHSWGFAVQTIILQPSPTPPQDSDFDTAYPIPPDCIHVLWIKLNLGDPVFSNAPRLALWKIAGT